MNHLLEIDNWIVVGTTLAIVSACVGLHFEVLNNCGRLTAAIHNRRRRVVLLIIAILVTHVVEIWLFAFGYYFLVRYGVSSLAGTAIMELPEYAYYSAMVFTTVGFGDVIPVGPIRFMTGMEALTGLVMITWSASLTFLEMQRDWPPAR